MYNVIIRQIVSPHRSWCVGTYQTAQEAHQQAEAHNKALTYAYKAEVTQEAPIG